jgi:hypothetical protein
MKWKNTCTSPDCKHARFNNHLMCAEHYFKNRSLRQKLSIMVASLDKRLLALKRRVNYNIKYLDKMTELCEKQDA